MLSDKVAIVIGGATGIGKAISLRLAKSGARVAICSRDRFHLDAAAAEFERLDCLYVQSDLASELTPEQRPK